MKNSPLFNSDFARSAVALMSGTTVAMAVPILAMPWLTRLYDPEDFGEVALFLQIAQVLVVFATGKYDQAIQLPRYHGHGAQLFAFSRWLTWIFSGAILVVVLALWSYTPFELNSIYLLLPLLVFAMSGIQQENQWLMRHREFHKVGQSKVVFVAASVPSRILFGYWKLASMGLAVGTVLGNIVSWGLLAYHGVRSRKAYAYSKAKMKVLALEHKDFPLINSMHVLSDMGRELAVLYLIGYFFGDSILGWYAVALRIVLVPVMLIGTSVGQVFYQRASERFSEGENIKEISVRTTKLLAYLGIPMMLLLALPGKYGFELLLGEDYAHVGRIVQIMSPWLFLNLILAPLSRVPFILKKQRAYFKIGIAGNLAQVVGLLLGVLYFGPEAFYPTFCVFIAVGVLQKLVSFIWIRSLWSRPA